MTHVTRVVEDLDRLIASLRPSANKQFKSDIHEYFKRLNTSLYRPTMENPQQIRDKILKKVAEKSDNRTQSHCSEVINNIMASTQIQKKAELFKFLLKYSEVSTPTTNPRYFQVEQKMASLNNQTQQTFYGNHSSYHQSNTSYNQHNVSSVSAQNPNFTKPRKVLNQSELQPLRNKGSLDQNISELDIITQICHTMQSLDTQLIKYTDHDTFELKEGVNVTETVRNIVSELCEIGWLYKKIIHLLKDQKGSIKKDLCAAVQEEINEYYRWLAIIETGVQMGSITLRTLVNWSYEPLQKLKWIGFVLESVQDFSGCTLISLVNSFRPNGDETIKRLLNNLLGHMIKSLLRFIHNWVYKGELTDAHKQFFVQEKSKYNSALEWFDRYRLVQKNIPNILDKDSSEMIFNAGKTISFLKNRCKCNYSVPINFIDPSKILNQDIHESSNILSVDFKRWLTAVYQNVSTTLVNQLRSQYHLSYHLESMKIFFLMGKGDFIQHLVDNLVMNAELQKPKHQVYETNMDGYITEARNNCFHDHEMRPYNEKMEIQMEKGTKSKFFESNQKKVPDESEKKIPEGSEKMIMLKGSKLIANRNKKQEVNWETSYKINVLERLLSKKVQFSDNTWDSFNFQYSMDRIEPLLSILTPDLAENYQRIFQFLWKIKRIEYILKSIWLGNTKEFPKSHKKNQGFKGFTKVLHRCHLLRCNMNHFVNTIYGYLMIAIESSWDKFANSLRKANSLDEIIKEHRLLHTELSSITFGSPNKKNLRDSLMNVFKSIEQFKTISSKIETEYKDYFEKMRMFENRKKIMVKGYLDIEEELQEPEFDEDQYSKKIMEITQIYDKTFKTFYENLKKDGMETNVLVFRLDFSEYFAMRDLGVKE